MPTRTCLGLMGMLAAGASWPAALAASVVEQPPPAPPHAATQQPQPEQWVCEMFCEPGKTYDKPGKCPICHMALTRREDLPFSANVSLASATLEPAKPATLKIELIDQVGLPVKDIEPTDGHAVHFWAFPADLGACMHEHPARQADGSFSLPITFPGPGDYGLFVEFLPTGFGRRIAPAGLNVAGKAPPAPAFADDTMQSKHVDDFTITLKIDPSPIRVGSPTTLGYTLSAANGSVTQLAPVEGAAPAVVVAVDRAMETLIRAAPTNGNPPGELTFSLAFPHPGFYRVFAQLRPKGTLITVPYTVNVRAAPASDKPSGR